VTLSVSARESAESMRVLRAESAGRARHVCHSTMSGTSTARGHCITPTRESGQKKDLSTGALSLQIGLRLSNGLAVMPAASPELLRNMRLLALTLFDGATFLGAIGIDLGARSVVGSKARP